MVVDVVVEVVVLLVVGSRCGTVVLVVGDTCGTVVLVVVVGASGAGQIMSMPQRRHSFHVFVRHLR
jgi:hypothetical protein